MWLNHSSGAECDAVGEDVIQEGVAVEEEGDEDGEDEGEDEEGEEEENEPDLEVEPEKDEATEPASAARDASVDEQPTPTMKRPAGAGTTWEALEKESGDQPKSKQKQPLSQSPEKEQKPKAKARPVQTRLFRRQPRRKREMGRQMRMLETQPRRRRNPDQRTSLTATNGLHQTEKRLKGELAEAALVTIRFEYRTKSSTRLMLPESGVLRVCVLCSQSLMFLESYVLRVFQFWRRERSMAEADLKAEAIRIDLERESKISRGYQTTNFLKRKFDKNRDALIVLAPWFPVLRFLCCDNLVSRIVSYRPCDLLCSLCVAYIANQVRIRSRRTYLLCWRCQAQKQPRRTLSNSFSTRTQSGNWVMNDKKPIFQQALTWGACYTAVALRNLIDLRILVFRIVYPHS